MNKYLDKNHNNDKLDSNENFDLEKITNQITKLINRNKDYLVRFINSSN